MAKNVKARLVRHGFLSIVNALLDSLSGIDASQPSLRIETYKDVDDLIRALDDHQVIVQQEKVIVVGFDEHGESYIAPGKIVTRSKFVCVVDVSGSPDKPVEKIYVTSGIQYVEILE